MNKNPGSVMPLTLRSLPHLISEIKRNAGIINIAGHTRCFHGIFHLDAPPRFGYSFSEFSIMLASDPEKYIKGLEYTMQGLSV
jgi:hypothetical protein